MIVRLALVGAMVDMAEDAKAELGVFVQHLAGGHLVTEMGGDEAVVLQHVADQRTHLLAPLDARNPA